MLFSRSSSIGRHVAVVAILTLLLWPLMQLVYINIASSNFNSRWDSEFIMVVSGIVDRETLKTSISQIANNEIRVRAQRLLDSDGALTAHSYGWPLRSGSYGNVGLFNGLGWSNEVFGSRIVSVLGVYLLLPADVFTVPGLFNSLVAALPIAAVVLTARRLLKRFRARRARMRGTCLCGYPISGSGVCPECGRRSELKPAHDRQIESVKDDDRLSELSRE